MACIRLLGTVTLLLPLLLSPASDSAQRIPPSVQNPRSTIPIERPEEVQMQQKLQKQRLAKRAEDMKRDSQKLLDLATELKNYVDKSGENILSVDVIRKAEEMEKLARQVKNNMRAQ